MTPADVTAAQGGGALSRTKLGMWRVGGVLRPQLERLPMVVCGLVLLVWASEARIRHSRQGQQWHTLTHKSATGNPLSPQPRDRPVLLTAIQGRLELLDSAGF